MVRSALVKVCIYSFRLTEIGVVSHLRVCCLLSEIRQSIIESCMCAKGNKLVMIILAHLSFLVVCDSSLPIILQSTGWLQGKCVVT